MARVVAYPAEPDDGWEHSPQCPAHPDVDPPGECRCDELEWEVYDRVMEWDEGGEGA